MTPDQIRRSWDDDDTPRSVFPEPLAERLTRENKELRAENERLRGEVAGMTGMRNAARRARDEADARMDALVADLRELADEHTGTVTPAPYTSERALIERLCAVLDKHAGEQAHDPAAQADDDCYCPDDHASWCPNLRSDKHAGEQAQGGEGS